MTTKQPLSLSDPITSLGGIGPKVQTKLEKLGISFIQDLLFHLPYRYIDLTRITPIGSLRAGYSAYIQGEIELSQVHYGKRRSLVCRVTDGTGAVMLRFFYFSKSRENTLKKGETIRCYGQVRRGSGLLEIVHPECHHIENDDVVLDQQLTPVYPTTEGLQQTRLRKLSSRALVTLETDSEGLVELLPDAILTLHQLPRLTNALMYVHRPPPDANISLLLENRHPAQKRLAYEELLAHQLSLLEFRNELRTGCAPALKESKILVPTFLKQLPFKLTNAQSNAYEKISADLNKNVSMLRLVQGDVGSGKTIVAIMAALQAVEAGYQVAIMAPTELLAAQHFSNFKQWLNQLKVKISFLASQSKKTLKANTLAEIQQDQALVIIGTHALLQESVQFSKLGLVIIDEQHRFGVHQRLTLLEKGLQQNQYPHQLVMTATPIPRTLKMTAYADLDHTIIDELPPDRKMIHTSIISNERREDVIRRVSKASSEGRQVYWVCTLIEESETLQCETAVDTYETLRKKLPDLVIGLVHGRMKNEEKEAAMRDFKAGKINLLVATTVIEVGVDVPKASLMIIDNAERMGLSQLHQLRGRIGRGCIESYCILMYQSPLGKLAKQRLQAMRDSSDGFYIAEKDLELRGPGEILGTRQTGLPEMRVANLNRDADLLPDVQRTAKVLFKKYPEKVKPLIRRWLSNNADYSNV